VYFTPSRQRARARARSKREFTGRARKAPPIRGWRRRSVKGACFIYEAGTRYVCAYALRSLARSSVSRKPPRKGSAVVCVSACSPYAALRTRRATAFGGIALIAATSFSPSLPFSVVGVSQICASKGQRSKAEIYRNALLHHDAATIAIRRSTNSNLWIK